MTFATQISDDAKAVLLLTSRMAWRDAPSLSPKEWSTLAGVLRDVGQSPRDLFADHDDDNFSIEPISHERVTSLLERGAALALELEAIEQLGISPLTVADDDYPARLRERLGPTSPPVLFTAGDRRLLANRGLGVVGSRDVDQDGTDVAQRAAAIAVEAGLQVISGGARGVDVRAMTSAAECGGAVLGVLADALIKRIREPETRQLLEDQRLFLLTEQDPRAGFSVGAAMSRNRILYGLADAVFVVASDEETGGTWNGARDALRRGWCPVIVWRGAGEGPGNAALARLGAMECRDLSELVDRITGSPDDQVPRQSSLFE